MHTVLCLIAAIPSQTLSKIPALNGFMHGSPTGLLADHLTFTQY